MKKILFITPYNPEKRDSGENVYSWDVLRSLALNKDYDIHVVSFIEYAKEKETDYSLLCKLVNEVSYVPFVYKNILKIGFSLYPAMIANRKTNGMISKIQQMLKDDEYDAVVVNHFRLAYIVDYIKNFKGKKIFISHNVEHAVSQSTYRYAKNLGVKLAYFLDFIKTRYWEKYFLKKYDYVSAICDVDATCLKKFLDKEEVFLLTPIVEYTPLPKEWTAIQSNKMIVCGSFTWTPKTLNLRRLLNAKNIGAIFKNGYVLQIIGRAPQNEIAKGNKIEGVYVSGEVDSVIPYYKESSVSLVPELAGGGFKLKIAEAIQYNLPIVAVKGAVTDLDMKPGIHYIEAETFEDLITKGILLMKDTSLRTQLVKNAKELFRSRYSIEFDHAQFVRILGE